MQLQIVLLTASMQAFFWVLSPFLLVVLSAFIPTVNIISTSEDEESVSQTSPFVFGQTSDNMIFEMSSFSLSRSEETVSPRGINQNDTPDSKINRALESVDFLADTRSLIDVSEYAYSDGDLEFGPTSTSCPNEISPHVLETCDTPVRCERAKFYRSAPEVNDAPIIGSSLQAKMVRLELRPSPVASRSPEDEDKNLLESQHYCGLSNIPDTTHYHLYHASDPLPVGMPRFASSVPKRYVPRQQESKNFWK